MFRNLGNLMEDNPDMKIIGLFRDPRGIWNSRLKEKWCIKEECMGMAYVCKRYETDLDVMLKLR